ncbi:hypothetical protein AX774_g5001 [Zancudomyces culisetae]|uniref:Uncharacterized protein n=1 Tax=Zancudomyces culisetae TaxID=1213189 RepID=A0A1R1PKN3_ZANCU|nr:hypothetical protein AX774_g5001 [Zancudomyces culisetae]|eukprot:OMH81538.1 hypothetical protein AX774_g5001 [Zancudomyces culisetae]
MFFSFSSSALSRPSDASTDPTLCNVTNKILVTFFRISLLTSVVPTSAIVGTIWNARVCFIMLPAHRTPRFENTLFVRPQIFSISGINNSTSSLNPALHSLATTSNISTVLPLSLVLSV